jgi:hypothetical protein
MQSNPIPLACRSVLLLFHPSLLIWISSVAQGKDKRYGLPKVGIALSD